MDPIRFTRPRSRQNVGAPGPRCPSTARRCYTTPFYPLFDPATKWLGQGKAFEYAQQNVNLDRVSRRPQAPARQAFMSSQEVGLGGGAWRRFGHARPGHRTDVLAFRGAGRARKTRPFLRLSASARG